MNEDEVPRDRLDAGKENRGDVEPLPSGFRAPTASHGRIAALVGVVVVIALVTVVVTRIRAPEVTTTTPAAPVTSIPFGPVSTGPISTQCPDQADVSEVDLRHAAAVLRSSPFEGRSLAPGVPSMEAAVRVGRLLPLGRVTSVRSVDREPYDMLPGEPGKGPTNSYAGNAAFWFGVRVSVATDGRTVDISIPLAVGGADVIEHEGRTVDRSAFDSLVDSCALLFEPNEASGPLGANPLVVAVAAGPSAPPVIIDRRFLSISDRPPSLDDLAAR